MEPKDFPSLGAPQDRPERIPLDEVRELAERIEQHPREVMDAMRRHGYKFKRFPRDMKKQPPVGDGERWEALAFSIYSHLGEAASQAVRLLNALDEFADVAVPARAHHEEKEKDDQSRVDGVPGVGQGDLPRKSPTGEQ